MRPRRPRWLPWIAALAATALFTTLGLWQLERARQKGDWVAAIERGDRVPAVVLPADPEEFGALAWQRVRATGRLRGDRQILLDNRIHDGRVGFDVLVPLIRGNGDVILVDRGWVPADRAREPARPIGLRRDGEIEVRGRLWRPGGGLALGPVLASDSGWPRVATRIDYEALGAALGVPLLPAVIRADPSLDWALEPRPLRPRFGPVRHVGYAVQWFALALTVVVVCAFVRLRGRRRDKS